MVVSKVIKKVAKKKSVKGKYKSDPVLSNTKKPTNLPVTEWQTKLRHQIAKRSIFEIINIGDGVLFSDYNVYNATTKNTYKIALRSADNGLNYCSCYDF